MTKTLEFRWTVSRAQDTYGYNICTLFVDGSKAARCNGGGYDMEGTALGSWIARAYADRLLALRPEDMPAQSHWQPARNPRRICENLAGCEWTNAQITNAHAAGKDANIYLAHDAYTCPHCGAATRADARHGKRVDDGRSFYGLTFHDPNYDPGKAVIGEACADRTLDGKAEGKTVADAEAAGESLGLERYQAIYSASSKHATERHTVPSIDGGCGMESVRKIMQAIGLTLEYLPTRSKKSNLYTLHDAREEQRKSA